MSSFHQTDQVPVGHIPRTMTIHLYGSMTRTLNPGDVVHISGIFLPTPYTGFRALRAGLLTDTYLEAQYVLQLKKQYDQMEMTDEIYERIRNLSQDPDLYTKIAKALRRKFTATRTSRRRYFCCLSVVWPKP